MEVESSQCLLNIDALQAKVKDIMENAFWDGVMESIKQEDLDVSWILKLMKEVREELCEMSPQSWKQEIVEIIDIDILSKVAYSTALPINASTLNISE